jgi:hypothetical protein
VDLIVNVSIRNISFHPDKIYYFTFGSEAWYGLNA